MSLKQMQTDDYSIKMLESYFESNMILLLEFDGKKFVSFCSIGVELNVMLVDYVNKPNWGCFRLFKGLRTLDLSNNAIDDIDCVYLGPALKEMKEITRLYLYGNSITDIGIEKLVPALKEMKGMRYLSLGNNNVTNAGKNEILEVCKSYKNIVHCWV